MNIREVPNTMLEHQPEIADGIWGMIRDARDHNLRETNFTQENGLFTHAKREEFRAYRRALFLLEFGAEVEDFPVCPTYTASDYLDEGSVAVLSGSRAAAAAIPDWATKNEAWILQWLLDNIGTPLAAPIPANPMTVQQIRAVLVAMIAIMDKIYTAQKANARMVIALRNETWPNLQE